METPSPSKGKGRTYILNAPCHTFNDQVNESIQASFNRVILNSLARQIRAFQCETLINLVALYLGTNYNDTTSQEIRDTLDEDLSIEIMLDHLVHTGMPIREAFLILTIFQLVRAFSTN
jgi:hypothetical protein